MSKIGRKPIPIPPNVKVEVKGNMVTVASADGKKKLTQQVSLVNVAVADNQVVVEAAEDSRHSRARHGLFRTLISNMIIGVTQGWSKTLEISGAGFKAEKQGQKLLLTVGYSKPKEFPVPVGVEVELPNPTTLVVKGIDKALVGQTAASLRAIRKPDPYKGKGIRYLGERAVRKKAKDK